MRRGLEHCTLNEERRAESEKTKAIHTQSAHRRPQRVCGPRRRVSRDAREGAGRNLRARCSERTVCEVRCFGGPRANNRVIRAFLAGRPTVLAVEEGLELLLEIRASATLRQSARVSAV